MTRKKVPDAKAAVVLLVLPNWRLCSECGHLMELSAKELAYLRKHPQGYRVICSGCLFRSEMER